jgi:hypothetical protein
VNFVKLSDGLALRVAIRYFSRNFTRSRKRALLTSMVRPSEQTEVNFILHSGPTSCRTRRHAGLSSGVVPEQTEVIRSLAYTVKDHIAGKVKPSAVNSIRPHR